MSAIASRSEVLSPLCFIGAPRCCSTAIGRDLLDGYVSAQGSARDYGIADALMLRNAAAREEENQ
jgi:hypothetical protein